MRTIAGERPYGEDRASQLAEEITRLEQRLQLMGMDGDCAYERAISRLYQSMVEERRQELAALQVC
jgi:hypothetical protein